MNIPVFKILLGDAEGILTMSLVEFPAVESDFLSFSKKNKMQFSLDEEQHIVFGCALRADFPIYRYDPYRGEYFVVFDKETIKDLYEKFMIEERVSNVNLEHSVYTNGVHLIQSFIKDTEKGISPVGFDDVADGSWFTAYKIENEEVWERVKSGEFKGFSVEGYFEIAPKEDIKDEIEALIDEILG